MKLQAIGWTALGMVLLAGGAAWAGENVHVPRLGVVRIQEVFKQYDYAKDQETKLKALFKDDEDAIDKLRKQIDEKKERLQHDPLIGKGTKQWKLEMLEIQRLTIEQEEKVNEFKAATRKQMADFYRTVYTHFRAAIEQYSKAYSFDLVLTAPDTEISKDTEDSPAAIQNEIMLRRIQYIGVSVDITSMIVELMNRNYKARKDAGGNL